MKKEPKFKNYTHFDNKCGKNFWNIIESGYNIKSHKFFPLIKFSKTSFKFNVKESNLLCEPKIRNLYYAAHKDSLIYQYYSMKLNDLYNKFALENGIDDEVIAYRTNKKGKCNINFAKEVIDYIEEQDECYIFLYDFSKFFDTLNHKYLKKELRKMFIDGQIPEEYYTLYKRMTKFSWINFDELLKIKSMSSIEIQELERFFTPKEFREISSLIGVNCKKYGIAQGTALSAIYSNVYMSSFDIELTKYIKSMNGLYRRYSDDIIIVIPKSKVSLEILDERLHYIFSIIPDVKVNEEKTEKYIKLKKNIFCINDSNIIDIQQKTKFSYLGFTYDGAKIYIREKSITKYFTKRNKMIKAVKFLSKKYKRKALRKSLYNSYSHLPYRELKYKKGKIINKSNFIKYVQKAIKVFGDNENVMFKRQIRKHWLSMHKLLSK